MASIEFLESFMMMMTALFGLLLANVMVLIIIGSLIAVGLLAIAAASFMKGQVISRLAEPSLNIIEKQDVRSFPSGYAGS